MKRGRKPKCPYCGSSHTVRKGTRKTVTMGPRPLAFCRSCNRKFTVGRTAKIVETKAVRACKTSGD